MKAFSNIFLCGIAAATLILGACNDKELPDDPVITIPVTSLVLEVSGEEYTAVPALSDDSNFTGELILAVKVPSAKATVSEISMMNGYTADISAGDEVVFADNRLDLNIYRNGSQSGRIAVVMQFNPPPFFYFVKTSDRDEVGDGYYLDQTIQARIASADYDNYFEGEVDLTASNWDNVALVSEDLSTIYNLADGPWPALSSYSWTAETKQATSPTHFKSEGPWNDWLVTNGNEAVISPGVWRVNFNSSTNVVDMTMTQWAVFGTATDRVTAMTYHSPSRSWSLETNLKSGSLHFETIPVSFGDPRFRLGYKADILGELAPDGNDIQVPEAGIYTITLKLSDSPYYTYSIIRKS